MSAAIRTPSGTATSTDDEERDPAEPERRRRALADHVGDVLAGRQRRPEVAVQDVADVVDVLRQRAGRRARAPPSAAATRAAGAVGPSAARTGSPGTRWIMKNVAVSRSASETSSLRRAANGVGRPGDGRPTASGAPASRSRRHLTSSAASSSGTGRRRRGRTPGPSRRYAVGEDAHRGDVAGPEQRPLAVEPVLAARRADAPRPRARRTA